MGLLTFNLNVTVDGCVDHREGVPDEQTHSLFTELLAESGAVLWGRFTYELMEAYWPAVVRGETAVTPAMREWAATLEQHPKYVVSSTRTDFPWANTHRLHGDLGESVQALKDATPEGVLLGSGRLAVELDRLGLIDEYKFVLHPRIAGHGPYLFGAGPAATRDLELVGSRVLSSGLLFLHYRRA